MIELNNKATQLVIGANSFLGKEICKQLSLKSYSVTGVYNKNKNNFINNIDYISILEMFESDKTYDVVYIVSAYIPNKGDLNVEERLKKVNVELVRNICNKYANAKIIYCSSVSVYEGSEGVIKENSKINPISLYAKSKILGENLVKENKKYAIVRISSMFGLNMKEMTFLPIIIKQAINKKTIKLLGDGSRLQNYISVKDVAIFLIESSKHHNNLYLATNIKSFSNFEIAKKIQSDIEGVRIVFSGIDNSKSFIYDNTFSRKQLKIKEYHNFTQSLKELIKWLKK